MKSMTGYGEAPHQVRGIKVFVQVRSLNHRHLDLQLRVPREYLSFEEEMRKILREKISRGRIDLFISRVPTKQAARKLELDEALLGQYLVSVKQIKKKFQLAGEVGLSLLSTVPDLMRVREPEVDTAVERRGLFLALRRALKKLEASRQREGQQLKADMEQQIRHLKKISASLLDHAGEIGSRLQQPVMVPKNGENIPRRDKEGNEVGNAFLKGDINEEVVRLKSHVAALARVMGERNPVGKKIDFMLQEIQRELNTISSKVPQLSVVRLVLEGKASVEKIREQCQNIE